MKNQNIAKPCLPSELEPINITGLHDDDSFTDCLIERCTLIGAAKCLNIERALIRGVKFEAQLRAAEFEDVVFENCDLSNVDLSDAILLRVSFINCRMTGINFSGAALKSLTFENDISDYANFHFARIEKALFSGCNCKAADFAEVIFTKVQFSDTNLTKAQMSGSSLCGIDFTSCDINGLGARPENLRGAVLSSEQAVTAAQIIGVIIR